MKKQKFLLHRVLVNVFPFILSMFDLFAASTELHAQFKEESAHMAYELRMQGDILYAATMLEILSQHGEHKNGLVPYEMSRVREHQRNGGAEWITPETIIGLSK